MQTSAMTTFNENVLRKMTEKNLTVKDLADRIGMHRQGLSRILNGHVDTTMGNAERIAEGLETPLYELVTPEKGRKGKPEPQAA